MKIRIVTYTLLTLLLCSFWAFWASAQVTITVAILEDPGVTREFEPLIEAFHQAHPDIQVELVGQFRENWDQLAVQIAGGVGPDVIAGYGVFTGHVMTNQVLLDLTPYIERYDLHHLVEDFAPAAIDPFRIDGAIYGFPKYTGTGGIFYNTHMFDLAGLAPPDPQWDWDDFRETARALTIFEADSVVQYGYNLNNMWTWIYPWFYAAGVDFSDPYRVPFDTPEAALAGTFLQEMQELQHLQFRFGRFPHLEAAMTNSGSWELTWMANEVPLGITEMPTGPAGKATQMNNDIIGINRDTPHPDEAFAFLRWWFGEENQRAYMETFGLQPARRSLGIDWLDTIADRLRGQGARVQGDPLLFLTATDYAYHEPMFADPIVVRDVMSALQRVIIARQPVEPTFEEMARTTTAYLESEAR